MSAELSLYRVGRGPDRAGSHREQRIAVPAYFWPSPDWSRIMQAGPRVGMVVINRASGPGTATTPGLGEQVADVRAMGTTVIGYVDTANAGRAHREVHADFDRYVDWYGVDGVFLDQAQVNAKAVDDYYRPLYLEIKRRAPEAVVVLNPGAAMPENVMSATDFLLGFEGSWADYRSWSAHTWTTSYPMSRFWHIVHGVDPAGIAELRQRSQAMGAGWLYATDQHYGTHPPGRHLYDRLPSGAMWVASLR